MFFIVFLYVGYLIFMLKVKRNMLSIAQLIIPILLLSIILTTDFAINYASSLNTEFNDGISIHGILMNNFFREDNWSVERFYEYYKISATVSVGLTIIYMFSLYIDRLRAKL